jgi:Ca2+-binding RTX toxin-like protein
MAYLGLIGAMSGDFKTLALDLGYFDDIAYVADNGANYLYTIRTYRGNDLIDLRDANAGNLHEIHAGAGNDTVLGGSAPAIVYDQSGNDRYQLGDGNDQVYAGRGNDTISGGAGVTDWLYFTRFYNDADIGSVFNTTFGVTCDLARTGVQDLGAFGLDRISGFENLEGGDGNDRLSGTNGNNNLDGDLGRDTLIGRGGNDYLEGENGGGLLIGGAGADELEGTDISAPARDILRYLKISDSGVGTDPAVVDKITRFDTGGTSVDDKIDLSRIDARPGTPGNDAFVFRGLGAFSSAGGEVRLEVIGANTLVHVDIDGDGATEMNILVINATGLTAVDFIL